MGAQSRGVLKVEDLANGRLTARGTTRGAVILLLLVPAGCLVAYVATGMTEWSIAAVASFIGLAPIGVWMGLRAETLSVESGLLRWQLRVAGRSVRDVEAPLGCVGSIGVRRLTITSNNQKTENFEVVLRISSSELPRIMLLFNSEDQAESAAEARRIGDALAIQVDLEPRDE